MKIRKKENSKPETRYKSKFDEKHSEMVRERITASIGGNARVSALVQTPGLVAKCTHLRADLSLASEFDGGREIIQEGTWGTIGEGLVRVNEICRVSRHDRRVRLINSKSLLLSTSRNGNRRSA
jgi:hypothetical protein